VSPVLTFYINSRENPSESTVENTSSIYSFTSLSSPEFWRVSCVLDSDSSWSEDFLLVFPLLARGEGYYYDDALFNGSFPDISIDIGSLISSLSSNELDLL